jgi:cold shock CspA family protein/ribosome-associated translation inhibitor RaiA
MARAEPAASAKPTSQLVPEIIFNGVDRSEWVENYVAQRLWKLERFAQGITRCHVTLKQEQGSQRKANVYSVTVEVRIPPQHDLAATKQKEIVDMPTQLPAVINTAFSAIERQVKRTAALRRNEQKVHVADGQALAMVERLFPDEGYGFLRTVDENREIYFHRNSVLNDDFDRLAVGTEVRFSEEEGEEGPQASSLHITGKAPAI